MYIEMKGNLEKIRIDLENDNSYTINDASRDLREATIDHRVFEYVNDIIPVDRIGKMIADRLGDDYENWISVMILLEGIKFRSDSYMFVDGYDNLRNVTNKDINDRIDDVLNAIESDINDELEELEEGEE